MSINDKDSWASSDDGETIDDEYDDIEDDSFNFYSICSYSHCDPISSPYSNTLESALEHDVTNYDFDLLIYLPSSEDDCFYEKSIILVNKARNFIKKKRDENLVDVRDIGRHLSDYLKSQQLPANLMENDESQMYFIPQLENDAILQCLDELQVLKSQLEKESVNQSCVETTQISNKCDNHVAAKAQEKIDLLETQLSRARECIASLTNDDDDENGAVSLTKRCNARVSNRVAVSDNDTYYFSSYSNTAIHETMLRDTIRTSAYKSAILSNADTLFHGKTVLDIGCGTGILSLFCAKAGAKKVIAVDNSDILLQAKQIVDLNGYGDVITCVRGKIESLLETNALPLLKDDTIDIIVSEWMGYALFFETMLPSVLVARDSLMTRNTGTMFPNVVKIFIEGANDNDRLSYWDNVYGFFMEPMKMRMTEELTEGAHVELVEDVKIVTNRAEVIDFNLNTCTEKDLEFESQFELKLRSDTTSTESEIQLHQLVLSFDVEFSVPGTSLVCFSTGCQTPPTHWKQTVLWFDPFHNSPILSKTDGDIFRGVLRMERNRKNHRDIDMAVAWETGRYCDGNSGSWKRKQDGVMKRSLKA